MGNYFTDKKESLTTKVSSKLGVSPQGIFIRVIGATILALLLVMLRPWPVGPTVFGAALGASFLTLLTMRLHLANASWNLSIPVHVAERLMWTILVLGLLGVQLGVYSLSNHQDSTINFLLIAPIVALAMLASSMLNPNTGIVGATLTCFMLGMAEVMPLEMIAAAWLAAVIGAHIVNPIKRRSDVTRAVGVQIVANVFIIATVEAFTRAPMVSILQACGWGICAAVIAVSVFWLAVPPFERAFGIVSDWTLLELCSPDQPLIHELCMRAPGTYAHSVMIGNLSEAAARAIGANPVKCRAMAIYHDIGKMNRPNYFVENQLQKSNAHDALSPSLSAQIIAAHVKEGVDMARAANLPQLIIDGIQQHHGTMVIGYFYSKAIDQGACPEDRALQQQFKYRGPIPQFKESAILHLADQAEAVSRAAPKDTDLTELVENIIRRSTEDGQLADSALSFQDLAAIKESFIQTLSAIYHERIPYPEADESLMAEANQAAEPF